MFEHPEAPVAPPAVLVVDDEETVRATLAMVVARAGGMAELAADAATARELVAQNDYACALIDKNLPDASGIEVLRFIKERCPRTEVLIVTGYANLDSAIEALRLGAFDYVVKPFDVITVVHRIQIALERRRMRGELDLLVRELKVANAGLAESRQEVQRAYLETVLRLSLAAEHKDDAADGHIRRVSRFAGLLARAVDATQEWTDRLVYAAPLHDIGKIGVPEAILRKPGPLTAEERAQMAAHVPLGARILEGTTSDVLALGQEVVLTHHERWDGGGYPKRLRGQEIPLSGRIVAVCDAWDAISTDRCYRKARPVDAAVAELSAAAGSQLDAALVTAFLDSLAKVRAVMEDTAEAGQGSR